MSSRAGVAPRVAIPAMPHIRDSGQPALAQLHPDLVAHKAQRRLEDSEALQRRRRLAQRGEQTGCRMCTIEIDIHPQAHAADLRHIVRKRQRVRTREIANSHSRGAPKRMRVAPEDRPSTLVAEKKGRMAEFLQELAQESPPFEEPLSRAPRDHTRYAPLSGLR